jgi:acetyl/propionyl-CoA carboxylase alpha subunit
VDRDAAIDRLARALDEVAISGVQTTLPFHRFIASDPGFRAGELSIDWVDQRWADIAADRRRAALWIAAQAATAAVERATPEDERRSTGPAPGPQTAAGATRWAAAGRARAVDRWPK